MSRTFSWEATWSWGGPTPAGSWLQHSLACGLEQAAALLGAVVLVVNGYRGEMLLLAKRLAHGRCAAGGAVPLSLLLSG